MIASLKPYPKYKTSGLPWLGDVPEHWEVRRFGSITKRRNKRNRSDLPLLSVVREKGVIPRKSMSDEENHNFIPDDLSNYQAVCQGDLVINKMKAWQGSLGIAGQDGIVSPAYYVFGIQDISDNYAHLLFRSKPYVACYYSTSNGIRIGQWDLTIPGLKQIPVIIPPLPEQAAIVRYLEYSDSRLRRYTANRRKMLTSLRERKQAVIQRAVTRGLDPDVRLKPSGVPWLGDVPAHWSRMYGRACYVEKKLSNTGMKETTVLSLSYGQIVIKPVEKLHGLVPTSFETYQIVEPGDIIVRPTDLQNDWNSLRFGMSKHRGIITSAYMCLHTTAEMTREYGYLLLHTYDIMKVFYGLGSGLRQNLDWTDFKYLPCFIPPIPEQKVIVRYLESVTAGIDRSIAALQRELSLLQEYRTRLFADVVTGKLDVRAAATALPEERVSAPAEMEAEELLEEQDADGAGAVELSDADD